MTEAPRPRALLLDLDDTLLDHSDTAASARRACDLVAARFAGIDAQQLHQANAVAWSSYWPEVEKLCWIGQVDGFAVSREAWRRALRACDCVDESIVEFAFEQHLQLGGAAFRLFADARDFLGHPVTSELRLAVVSNGASDLQRFKLRALGLQDRFDAVVISAEVGLAKPDPALFELALERLSVEPADTWHIGDSLATDVAGALAAGVSAVWLNRRGASMVDGDPRPHLEVASFAGLPDVLVRTR